ncbi:MAG: hypothetical protein O2960_22125 [Verrucomicrobia bacterium]|nr:hypothetical protein [Verrucomicrobiota bacterium]
MPDLKLTVTAQISSGPALTFLDTLQPEGYGSTTITVPGGSSIEPAPSTVDKRVKVRLAADKLALLMITADKYSDKIKISNGSGADERIVPLTNPLLISGGVLDLLTDHEELTIENSGAAGADDAVLTILSAGDVTPP